MAEAEDFVVLIYTALVLGTLILRHFALTPPCQFTQILNLRSLGIFGLTSFGWPHYITLTSYFRRKYRFYFTSF